MRPTTTELLLSGEVKDIIEKTTYIFLLSFPLDIDFTEDIEPDILDQVSVQKKEALRWRQTGIGIASGGMKDIMLECWLSSQLPSQTMFSCICWNLD